jgi:hypothetical protein
MFRNKKSATLIHFFMRLIKDNKFWEELIVYIPFNSPEYLINQVERKHWYIRVMKAIKQPNLGGCSVGIIDGSD